MNRARTGSGEANTDFAGEFCMRACHERRHLFVAYLHVVDSVPGPIDRADDAVNSVTRITVDALEPPLGDSFDQKVARCFSHAFYRRRSLVTGKRDRAEQ